MEYAVPIIIVVIIGLQAFFFAKNYVRMQLFRAIFRDPTSWSLIRNDLTGFVIGVKGSGNEIFNSIVNSINKYLGNNAGSIIDFGLLKDSVDRHCDSVENDIATQTPIPLYWGLAGTMAGVIIGLWDLLNSDAIMTLMGSGSGAIGAASQNAAGGINSLLSGVAWAMLASICGIILTTINSLLFKKCKLEEEEGKNSFLAWMQSRLLPELPSDTSEALNNLVKNLNEFNHTFAHNTANLGSALEQVNESYDIQAQIIQHVHDMDVMKMARANVKVLEQLEQTTGKLEAFNKYLQDIEGYTEAIHRFESLFGEQAERLHVLEEIRDFFHEHKAAINKSVAMADDALKESIREIKDSTTDNLSTLHSHFIEQSETFKNILREEQEAFERFSREIKAQFTDQLSIMPQMTRQLEQISSIPAQLDKLCDRIEKSNQTLLAGIHQSMRGGGGIDLNKYPVAPGSPVPKGGSGSWVRITGVIALVIIAIASLINLAINFNIIGPTSADDNDYDVIEDTTAVDSVVATEEAVAVIDTFAIDSIN